MLRIIKFKTIKGYGNNNFLVDSETGSGYKLSGDHKGQWPLAFYLLLRDKFFNEWKVVNSVPITR